MHNRPEHVESILACWRARAVPCNVNYQYTASEIAELFRMLGTRGVVYERGLAPLLRDALAQLAVESDRDVDVLVELDDGSDAAGIPGAVDFESVVAAGGQIEATLPGAGTSPDDIYIACTGGTTGRPKAVLWRQGDLYVAAIGGTDETRRGDHSGARRGRRRRVVPHVAADARRRAVDGVPRREHGRDRRAARRQPPLRRPDDPRHRGARACQHDDDHRRRVRATAASRSCAPTSTTCRRSRCWAPEARPPAPARRTRSPRGCPASPSATATARRRSG